MPAAAQLRTVVLGDGVRAGYSTRAGGASAAPYDSLNLAADVGDDPLAVVANQAALLDAVGADWSVVWAGQVHGAEVAVVDESSTTARTLAGVDALVTDVRGVLLCIRVADCLPVLFADVRAGVVGGAHAGRRGLVAGVLANTVAAMEALGARRSAIRAAIGPGICGGCYEVPAELAAEVDAAIPGSRATTRIGTPSLDLRLAAQLLLEPLGLADVQSMDECTKEQADAWYSYRRTARTGRFCGYVGLA